MVARNEVRLFLHIRNAINKMLTFHSKGTRHLTDRRCLNELGRMLVHASQSSFTRDVVRMVTNTGRPSVKLPKTGTTGK